MKRPNVVDESEFKDKVKFWIKREMRVGNIYRWERQILSNLDDIPLAPLFAPYVKHWFAGAAQLCPLTEPRPFRHGLSTTMVRLLISAAIQQQGGDRDAAQVLVDRACDLCEQFLYETTAPYDVNELNVVLSHDDDEQIVALDASMRLEGRIRRNSPLHPLRFMLTWLQSCSFDSEAILEILFDDTTGKTGGFPLLDRFYEWARERRAAVRAAARTWRGRHWSSGGWYDASVPLDDEEDEEEEEEVMDTSSSSHVEDEEEPFEFDIQFADIEMGVEPENGEEKSEPANAEEKPEPANAEAEEPEPEDEEDDDDEDTAPFLIIITQMAGEKEEKKTFLLAADEEPRRLVLPSRKEECAETDVWPRLVQMTKRLARRMESVAKNKESLIRREARELAENMRLFLEAEKTYND